MLSGDSTVVQASALDGLSFDPFSFREDGSAAPEVDVSRCQIAPFRQQLGGVPDMVVGVLEGEFMTMSWC